MFVDPSWGVSQQKGDVTRKAAALFTQKYYEYDPSRIYNPVRQKMITAYDRCKANRRCNWGIQRLNQSINNVDYYHRLFDRGNLYDINLYLDFEDWRLGSRGFSWKGNLAPMPIEPFKSKAGSGQILGAHFWPYDQKSLGPDIPCFLEERNQGLILDRSLQLSQIEEQEALVSDLIGRVDWLGENIEWANMSPQLRSRKDVRRNLTWVQDDFRHWLNNEQYELHQLNSSQCVQKDCWIQFNTSSLLLTGAITGKGVVRYTSSGTEAAVFTFNSIYLGPEVKVTVVGQRALVIMSKTSAVINTTISAVPGTLGGFPGGGSVARLKSDALSDSPMSIYICDLNNYCSNSPYELSGSTEELITNNVNGPGSGNLRIVPFVIKTTAAHIPEIQTITTLAAKGQTLAGGFVLKFKQYSTTIIPHDCSPLLMKQIIEDNLNIINPSAGVSVSRTDLTGAPAGVGIVNVSRSISDATEGYTWTITFTTAIGNIEQLQVKSYLIAAGAQAYTRTIQDGNEIGGTFSLSFQGYTSSPIPAAATAAQLQAILLEIPVVTTAFARRTDPTQNCDDGLCLNGPYPARGLLWSIFVTTDSDNNNITPTSPTSSVAQDKPVNYLVEVTENSLTGTDSEIQLFDGTSDSPDSPLNLLNVSSFSLAYGGAGGSYGGSGGAGYTDNPVGGTYNTMQLDDLLGGSGGCMSQSSLFQINAALGASGGMGGAGGGAIEIVSANDLTIGSWGKILMRGGAGEQTSNGGGGGGSGGAILLASATAVKVDGVLDVSGGDGGFGGVGLNGGGGGGGRIAIYADSITTPDATILKSGGSCGIYQHTVVKPFTLVELYLYFTSLLPIEDSRILYLASQQMEYAFASTISDMTESNVTILHKGGNVNYTISYSFVFLNDSQSFNMSSTESVVNNVLNTTRQSHQNIAQLIFLGGEIQSISSVDLSVLVYTENTDCSNNGEDGTFFDQAYMTTYMYVGSGGAENTGHALFFSNRETTITSSGSIKEAPFAGNGPIVSFNASRPERITYYTKMQYVAGESLKSHYGALFTLISRGEAGLNISNVIGVYFGGAIMNGANFGSAVDEKVFLKRMVTIDPYPAVGKWYKIDIKIQWVNQTYSVAINDTVVASTQSFSAKAVDGIRLSVFNALDVWFDEIYVGFDNTMEFQCPLSSREGTSTAAPVQRGWSFNEVHGAGSNGYTEYREMQRHYNFLDTTGSIPFDGQGAVSNFQDIGTTYLDGDYAKSQGYIQAGALVYITDSLRSRQDPLPASATLDSPQGLWSFGKASGGDGRQFWYTEYNYESELYPSLNGGVAACSSQDLVNWRFEGIVFHYANLTDLVYGYDGPFYAERPKVLFNAYKQEYVMWATMDREKRDLAMAMIASSPYEDGPFLFRRSFYPDGNQTRDQVIFVNDEGQPVLARTYYQTVEYVLPEAMMQPVWESAKSISGSINYRSNYHRAFYSIGYDNYNDIYLQRWTKEDKPYSVYCRNKITGEMRNASVPGQVNDQGFVCDDPSEEKIIYGQGAPVIKTRFVSPNDSQNSWWRPTSVPAVNAQDWSFNYRDGYCGIRKLNDDYNTNEPNLADFTPLDRSTCSNIADNPIHATPQDKLVGVLHVVLERRAKYVAVSRLTPDYLDTNGVLTVFEGQLESGNLISLIANLGQFGFGSGDSINSTFYPPQRADEYDTAVDYNVRFSQYVYNQNDRATYSLACVLDGYCSVNFKDQITDGNY